MPPTFSIADRRTVSGVSELLSTDHVGRGWERGRFRRTARDGIPPTLDTRSDRIRSTSTLFTTISTVGHFLRSRPTAISRRARRSDRRPEFSHSRIRGHDATALGKNVPDRRNALQTSRTASSFLSYDGRVRTTTP